MSHAIFRVQGIKTTSDLRGIGKHNDERISLTNEDIDRNKSQENIVLVSLGEKSYLERFSEIVEPYKQEHEERMQSMRADRVKSFEKHINSSKSDVAAEFLFSSDEKFFKDKSKEEIQRWAKESLDFITNDIGIKKDNIIQAVVHMDEKTPHLHVVAVPLVRTEDKRRKQEVWQISRKKFIPKKEDMTKLQDKYHARMNEAGFSLDRGEKSDRKHIEVQKFKEQTLSEQINHLENTIDDLEDKLTEKNKEVKNIEDKLSEAYNALIHIKNVEEVEYKEGRFGSTMVKLDRSDFEGIKTLAKQSEWLRTKNGELQHENKEILQQNVDLKRENGDLRTENKKLQKENKELKEENNFLQNVIDLTKNYYKDKVKGLAKRMGAIKSTVADYFGLDVKKYISNDLERKGHEEYQLAIQKKNREKELQKNENELEL